MVRKISPDLFYMALVTVCLAAISACKQPAQQQTVTPPGPAVKAILPQPFRYHKLIESSPGKYFDVYTWGRGKDSSGAYLILHSDSTGSHYSTTYGDLEGSVIDVYNTDMNMDGNPEILIESKAKDTTNHINIYAYEFKGGKGQKIDFPKLSTNTKKTYRGGDVFSIKEGNLVRQFPVYDGNGPDAKPTGKTKILQYGISDNTFTVKDISPVDSTKTSTSSASKPAGTTAVSAKSNDKPASSEKHTESKKKKKKTEEHTRKKKKHHRSEE
ncbi:hypothetical protein BEL04_14370 [Mucilaginibacter sp. PPCGB 2223]|uniref:hypothetical protein n=1 Tax=Mucilaginibacter sp. PPCGB 2223 TaxID=1886027 RepID=UPI0008261DBE|nr:hypothetical protein [Mucilaginibacter sp. PPCGB 2223]OCX52629.1 hypothetical protein BEL04_14370 [Mucilaginibacter sp. PPCGB 2223]